MLTPKRVNQPNQPGLFDPPLNRPAWAALPPTVRAELTKLVEAMLRRAVDRVDDTRVATDDEERGNE